MSRDTSCLYNYTQVLQLFEKKELRQDLAKTEAMQVYEYTLRLAYLESYGSVNDKENVEEVAAFFSYFCKNYNYYSLPGEVNLSFDVAYFSDQTSFMGTAYAKSDCTDSFWME